MSLGVFAYLGIETRGETKARARRLRRGSLESVKCRVTDGTGRLHPPREQRARGALVSSTQGVRT
jgi:hypothetical protein